MAQARLTPGSSSLPDVPELVPARMLNEFAYCPRLAYLEWVQGDFADSADTVDGRHHHRRVDKEAGELPAPNEMAQVDERLHARSVYLSGPNVGLVARIDLVEADGSEVTPVDYKRGEAPDVPEGAWEPERVQLCAQGLVLEENGYVCRQGVLYFAGSRRRVTIPFTPELRARTVELLGAMREAMGSGVIPPPLQDSPKCPRCSLVGICLPDEANHLRLPEADADEPRRLIAARDDALPLYVQSTGTRVGRAETSWSSSRASAPARRHGSGRRRRSASSGRCRYRPRRFRRRSGAESRSAISRMTGGFTG